MSTGVRDVSRAESVALAVAWGQLRQHGPVVVDDCDPGNSAADWSRLESRILSEGAVRPCDASRRAELSAVLRYFAELPILSVEQEAFVAAVQATMARGETDRQTQMSLDWGVHQARARVQVSRVQCAQGHRPLTVVRVRSGRGPVRRPAARLGGRSVASRDTGDPDSESDPASLWEVPKRDVGREQQLLRRAELIGGVRVAPGFGKAVARRLKDGERMYRGSALERPAVELVGEAIEEALDLAAWTLLADAVLTLPQLNRVEADLRNAMNLAARAFSALRRAQGELEVAS